MLLKQTGHTGDSTQQPAKRTREGFNCGREDFVKEISMSKTA